MTDADLTSHPVSTRPSRRHRIGIFGPFIVVVIAAAAWSGYWFYTASQIEKRVAQHKEALIKQGYQVSFDPWKVGGYPIRMYVAMNNVTVIAPSGKGFAAPRLEAEANAYALDKWVMVAPKGMTLYRGRHDDGDWGKVEVTGRSLKASVSGLTQPIYNVAIQAQGLVLTPSDPARPFMFSSADNVEAYLRPTTDSADSADFLIRATAVHGQPGSAAGDLSHDKPLSLHAEGSLSHFASFAGAPQGEAVNQWRNAGGAVNKLTAELNTGELDVMGRSDALTFDAGKRLTGHIDVEMKGTFRPVEVLVALRLISDENLGLAKPLLDMTLATQGTQKLPLDFKDGKAWIGPLKVSDAPILP